MRDIVDLFERLAIAAGDEILRIRKSSIHVEYKADQSPVTLADQRAETIILNGLNKELSDISVIAEEDQARNSTCDRLANRFILVDPLDGTKEFINNSDEYTVNIALIEMGKPIVGVVYAPATQTLYGGSSTGAFMQIGAGERQEISVKKFAKPPRVLASKSHITQQTRNWVQDLGKCDFLSIGSSLKFCLMARGDGDIYPRFGPTMKWDTAAGDAVLRAAGGATFTTNGTIMDYGHCSNPDIPYANPHFIALSRCDLPPDVHCQYFSK